MDIKDKARIINSSSVEDLTILLSNYRSLLRKSSASKERLSLIALKNATKHKLRECNHDIDKSL